MAQKSDDSWQPSNDETFQSDGSHAKPVYRRVKDGFCANDGCDDFDYYRCVVFLHHTRRLLGRLGRLGLLGGLPVAHGSLGWLRIALGLEECMVWKIGGLEMRRVLMVALRELVYLHLYAEARLWRRSHLESIWTRCVLVHSLEKYMSALFVSCATVDGCNLSALIPIHSSLFKRRGMSREGECGENYEER